MTWRKAPPQKRDRSDEFASMVIDGPRARMAQRLDAPTVTVKSAPAKIEHRKVQSIRDSARGEECTVRIVGACYGDKEHTIWSHAPLKDAGKGLGLKAIDLCGAYCCTACDAVIDGQRPLPPGASRTSVLMDWMHGHLRSLVRLGQKGLL